MTTLSYAHARNNLVDHVVARSLATDVGVIFAGVMFTALLAQIAIPLWPVPVTGQSLAVLLVGATLGATRGALVMLAYAIAGGLGAPIFTEASSGWSVIFGPTGGYIVGFIFAAWLTGWCAAKHWEQRFTSALAVFAASTVITFAFGLAWLSVSLGFTLEETLTSGLYPFIIGGVIKTAIAAGLLPLLWRTTRSRTDHTTNAT